MSDLPESIADLPSTPPARSFMLDMRHSMLPTAPGASATDFVYPPSPASKDLLRALSLPPPESKIKIGICAMDKKANSKPMQEICQRLVSYGDFEIQIFGDETILHKPIEQWPEVHCLLSWFSEGFPLDKACAYVALRRPYLINDLHKQGMLQDRRKVYEVLQQNNIMVPPHIVVSREDLAEGDDPPGFDEHDDYVELNGVRVNKPFVEKPVSGEDHNIYIYYPHNFGGGVKMLFRKRGNQSSAYVADHPGTVRRAGSYIYEEFLSTAGTDVKVYTVGPQYAHAEARKSPVVDGKVHRTPDGKEVRYPVLLSPQEKDIAHKVCLAFGQKVCGFDLLRTGSRSYVCDVNGWSFVKNSTKYYDDAAGILHADIVQALAPHRLNNLRPLLLPGVPALVAEGGSSDSTAGGSPIAEFRRNESSWSLDEMDLEDALHGIRRSGGRGELRCVLAVIRHGDRTPKQKVKVVVHHPRILELYLKFKSERSKQAKLKSPQQLSALLEVTQKVVEELHAQMGRISSGEEKDRLTEKWEKFRIIRTVLEQEGGRFAGINRKAQLKPLVEAGHVVVAGDAANPPRGDGAAGGAEQGPIKELLLIFKWGGVLTHAGRTQAEMLGRKYRKDMYPMSMGGGLLRLHSTYRHDFKIFSSDEGRVQTSAAAFTKSLLDLEGTSLTPILVSMIDPQKKKATMLDAFGKGASGDIRAAKARLAELMTSPGPLPSAPPTDPIPLPSTTHPAIPAAAAASAQHSSGSPFSPPQSPQGGNSRPMSPLNHPSHGSGSSQIWTRVVPSESESESEASFPMVLRPRGGLPSVLQGNDDLVAVHVRGLPEEPREKLVQLEALMGQLLIALRPLSLDLSVEEVTGGGSGQYNSLMQAPGDWHLDPAQPCGGEKVLLLLDRWHKLHQTFYNRKKNKFDITKIPDIYDSAKYDAIHNSHLGVDFMPLYTVAKELADVVIPSEYGLTPKGKLRIGWKICKELLGKLLCDMGSMREESRQCDAAAALAGESSQEDIQETNGGAAANGNGSFYSGSPSMFQACNGPYSHPISSESSQTSRISRQSSAGLDDAIHDEVEHDSGDQERLYRLDPAGAPDIFAPSRHVRTRIYFTSESHIHSLMNVLQYCSLGQGHNPIIRPEGQEYLDHTPERDYVTQIVFRMYEDTLLPLDDPNRFRVELWFSPGASRSPAQAKADHLLLPLPLHALHPDDGTPFALLERTLEPFAQKHKYTSSSYAAAPVARSPHPTTSDAAALKSTGWSRASSMGV